MVDKINPKLESKHFNNMQIKFAQRKFNSHLKLPSHSIKIKTNKHNPRCQYT